MNAQAANPTRPPTSSSALFQWVRPLLALALLGMMARPVDAQAPLVEVDFVVGKRGYDVSRPMWTRALSGIALASALGPQGDSYPALIDLRNPWAAPLPILDLPNRYTPFRVYSGGYYYRLALQARPSAGLCYLEVYRMVGNEIQPVSSSLLSTNLSPAALAIDGNVGCVAGTSYGPQQSSFLFLDISDPRRITITTNILDAAGSAAVTLQSGKALISRDWGSWRLVDVADPKVPVPTDVSFTAYNRSGNRSPLLAWPYAYAMNVNGYDLDVHDLRSPGKTTSVSIGSGRVFRRVTPRTIIAEEANNSTMRSMQIIDISEPGKPLLGGSLTMAEWYGFSGDWLFGQTSRSDGGQTTDEITVWNLSNATNPLPVARFASVNGPIVVWGNWLYQRDIYGSFFPTAVYDIGGIIDPDRAAGSPVVLGGFVARIDVKRPGARYMVPPRVRVVSSTGSGAEVRAVLDAVGRVSAFEVMSPGSGYSVDARVEVASPDRTPRMAEAAPRIENGFVVGFDITDPGSGYDAPPPVRLVGPSGRGAVAEAVLDVDGAVESIRVVNPGAGYAASTTALVRPPVVPEQALELTPGHRLLRGGTMELLQAYEWQELKGTTWQRMALPIVTNPLSSVVFLEGPGDGSPVRLARLPLPVAATATPSVVNGFLVDITVNEGGTGYATPPRVLVSGGGGTGALATAQVAGGKVVKVVVDNPGRGYVQAPSITLDPPPVVAVPVTVAPALRLRQSGLSADLEYRLQSSENLLEWTDVSPWSAGVEPTRTAFSDAGEGQRFYRLQRRPW